MIKMRLGLIAITIILALLLIGAIGMDMVQKSVYLPIVVNGQAKCTPTLAPTMCPGWYEYEVCSPTPTPYTICIPGPCTEGE